MNCEGIWKVEITTPYGWERIATAFMRNGEYLAASANHYSVGTYKQDGSNLVLSTHVTQYGDLRTVFGLKTSSAGTLHPDAGRLQAGIQQPQARCLAGGAMRNAAQALDNGGRQARRGSHPAQPVAGLRC